MAFSVAVTVTFFISSGLNVEALVHMPCRKKFFNGYMKKKHTLFKLGNNVWINYSTNQIVLLFIKCSLSKLGCMRSTANANNSLVVSL